MKEIPLVKSASYGRNLFFVVQDPLKVWDDYIDAMGRYRHSLITRRQPVGKVNVLMFSRPFIYLTNPTQVRR